MSTAYLVVTLFAIAANTSIATADLAGSWFVVRNAAEVGLSRRWLPLMGALKGAGAAGPLLGLLGFQIIGVAAATGLVVFFVGAIGAHLRARVFNNIVVPSTFLVLAVASLAFAVRH